MNVPFSTQKTSNLILALGTAVSIAGIIFWVGFQYGTIHDLKVRVAHVEKTTQSIDQRLAIIQAEVVKGNTQIHELSRRVARISERQQTHDTGA